MTTLLPSVIVSTHDILAMARGEPEQDPILVIHSNTVEPGPVALKFLQPVGGSNSQIFNGSASIQ
jgi:hypothetical protein